jgi:hypothetical protein
MALFDDIPVFEDILSGGNWVTGLAIGIGAFAVLPLAAPVLRPLAKTAIKGGILAYRGAAGLVGDLVAEVAAEGGGEIAAEAVEAARKQHERGRQKQRLRQKKPRLGRRRGFSTGDPGLGEIDRPIRLNETRPQAVPHRKRRR